MNHASLFTGIGGFDLAASWMGWNNVFQVEIDDFCHKVLTKHFPETDKYRDIYEFKGEKYRGQVDIISGGFPCQPFSQAGKRQGTKDNRYLWPEMLRVIKEVQPAYVVGENVVGLVSMENGRTLERILADLENEGYRVEVFIIPACSVGAWHRRDRIWIVANSRSERQQGPGEYGKPIYNKASGTQTKRPFNGSKAARNYWKFEPNVGRVAHGVPGRVHRLKSLGNAIVPQVAYEIFKAIEANE